MENQDDIANTIIPTAGYLPNQSKPKQPGPNKKVIIIIAAIALSIIVVIAIIIAIILTNREPETVPENQTNNQPAEEEDPKVNQPPAVINDNNLLKNLASKTNHILTHGIFFSSAYRSTNAPIFYTEKKNSDYFANLSSADKMSIILSRYQNTHDQSLTSKEISSLSSKNCKLLFNESNCKLIKSNINPEKYRKIAQKPSKLKQEYKKLFGKVGNLPKRVMSLCPYFTYVDELNSYVYEAGCGKTYYDYAHYYLYDFRISKNTVYVYFAGAISKINKTTGKLSLLYKDMDAETLFHDTGNYSSFKITNENYGDFQHYRFVFKKDSSGNYIYQGFEQVDDIL